MNYSLIEKDVKAYVHELYSFDSVQSLPFHNLSRTNDIVKAAKKMAVHYSLDEKSTFIVIAAAFLINTGYIFDPLGNPALKSVEVASEFLKREQLPEEDIIAITECIKAGLGLKKPSNHMENIASDANTFYLGTPDFKSFNKLRRKELGLIQTTSPENRDWTKQSIDLLESHEYYTDFCRSLQQKIKMDNLSALKNKQQKQISEVLYDAHDDGSITNKQTNQPAEPGVKIKPPKEPTPVRGIETMFRISSANNVRISVMADNKAHIMITVNSIIISVVLGLIVRNIDSHYELLIPSLILLLVNLFTIIYSVLATRPTIVKGFFTEEQVERKTINMLYFGSFYNMEFKEYNIAMKKVMTDSEFLYACLIKDLFWKGKVLGRKYKLLRTAYTIFLFGIIVAVVAFAIAGSFFE